MRYGAQFIRRVAGLVALILLLGTAQAAERTEAFDADPNWDGQNNRPHQASRTVRQDFGYSAATSHAGGMPGEIGGFISPAAEPAYYAKRLEAKKTFDDALSASGRLLVSDRPIHLLIGFFNSHTVNEWRTPNTVAIRVIGRGDVFYAYVEYATSRWRAGGDDPGGFATIRNPQTGRAEPRGFKAGVPHEWTLRYDPAGNGGAGSMTVTIDDEKSVCNLAPGHKADGAEFDRFGILPVLKSADTGGEVWLDDVSIDGRPEDFRRDPEWEGKDNHHEYATRNVRPWFDFGFSPTGYAGGKTGELGGLTFRGDCRYPERLAAYGDRLMPLSLETPLRAAGKVSLRRGVSDSTTLLGFYHSQDSLEVTPSQSSGFPKSFLGVAIEGPSREGFLFYPAYRTRGDGQGNAQGDDLPHILPDGQPHDWSLSYDPAGTAGRGRITVTFDGTPVALDLAPGDRKAGARFDRFGLVTTWIDGNGQQVYFDDLTYTCAP